MNPLRHVCLYIFLSSEEEVKILICRNFDILSLSLPDLTFSTLPMGNYSVLLPLYIDYNPVINTIYWADIFTLDLNSKLLPNGTNTALLTANDTKEVYGVAVDSHVRKVFYTDKLGDYIGVVDLDGNNDKKLGEFANSTTSPSAITLDHKNRKIYFAVHDVWSNQFIGVVNYDGTERRTVADLGIGDVTGITLDKTEGVLYWCDKQRHKIESVFINGTGRKELFYSPSSAFSDIYLFGKILYFTEAKGIVYAMNTKGGSAQRIITFGGKDLYGLVVYSNKTPPGCAEGRYGASCRACGQCLEPKLCEPFTGLCLGGCKKGYGGKSCEDECKKGSFGRGCQSLCHGCANGDCDRFNGTCLSACKPGWTGFECSTYCGKNNTFGLDCKPCGACLGEQACSPVTGNCPKGCEDGWSGTQCKTQNCPEKTFGPDCKPCGVCQGHQTCSQVTGNCPGGCEDGWSGLQCQVTNSGCTFAMSRSLLAGVMVAVIINMWSTIWTETVNRDSIGN